MVQGGSQRATPVAPADLPPGFRSHPHHGGPLARGLAVMQVAQRQSPEHAANRLYAAAENFIHLFTVLLLQTHANTPIGPHAQVYAKTFENGIVLKRLFQAVEDLDSRSSALDISPTQAQYSANHYVVNVKASHD